MTSLISPSDARPSRAAPRGTDPLERLFDRPVPSARHVRGTLTRALAAAYDGDLAIPLRPDRPTVVANFVETLDGVVAFDRDGRTGGGEVSGFSTTDRFVMGLLRALADVVLVGGATIRSSKRAAWTPASISPAAGDEYAALRASLGLAMTPTTLIATSSGDLDPQHPVFGDPGQPIIVAGPPAAADRLVRLRLPSHVEIERLAGDGIRGIRDLIHAAGSHEARLVVSEAGPRLFGELLRADRVDELFLTVAPQLAGRADPGARLGLVEGIALWPGMARWARLASARRAGDHLFLRYRFEETDG